MSTVQNDQAALEGRKPIDTGPVDLRDKIVTKLRTKLVEDNLAKKISTIMVQGDSQRQLWLQRQHEYLQDWDDHLEASSDGPFESASNLKSPITYIACKAFHARYMQAILGIEPFANIKARQEPFVDVVPIISDTLQYTLKSWMNHNEGCKAVIDDWLWRWITNGSAVLKRRWHCEYETFEDVVQSVQPQIQVQNGQEIVVPVMHESAQKVTKKVFEGPIWECIDIEDLLIIGGQGNIQQADSVHHTMRLTASEILGMVDQGLFDKDAADKVILSGADQMTSTGFGVTLKYQRLENAGMTVLKTQAELDRYEIVESYMNYDVEGNGINSKIVVWTHRRTSSILRATYLRRIDKYGVIPLHKIDFHRRPGMTYGVGVPELLHPIATEITSLHNQRIDAGTIANMPVMFYRSTSSIEPASIPIRPGMMIPVDNPQTDIYIPQYGNKTTWSAQEEQMLGTWVERLLGINDLTLGAQSGTQGAARTAQGVRAMLGESNINLNVPLARLNVGWRQALQDMVHTLQQRIPEGLSFRVTGEQGWDYWVKLNSKYDIYGDYEVEITSASENSNQMIQQDLANQNLQMSMNPLLLQTGVVTMRNLYEALKNWYKANGVKEYAKYITAPNHDPIMLAPAEEMQRLMAGQQVPVLPQADHEGFLNLVAELMSNEQLLGTLSQDQTVAVAKQAQEHKKMMAALQQQAAQAANVQQQQTNTQMGTSTQQPGAAQQGVVAPPGAGGA